MIDGMDRVRFLRQPLIERTMLCTCFFLVVGGESEDVGNLEGGVSDPISFELFRFTFCEKHVVGCCRETADR